jgi:predicted short-subunit dehydrogenase-like oxidoreductase (DUF2520 family)
VPDARIRELAQALAPFVDSRATVLHCAGAQDVAALAAPSAAGASVGVFHPLVSFASPTHVKLRGATFTTFGDARAVAVASRLARRLGAHSVALSPPGPAYHAAAALVANGAAALAYAGARILVELGFEQRAAERALGALLHSVAENVARVGVPSALTGPVVRGDIATVAEHVRALAAQDPASLRAYLTVQPLVVDSALAAGLAPELARELLGVSASGAKRAQLARASSARAAAKGGARRAAPRS